MQPYFFPYLGHFSLIANVDSWIVFDVTQYTPKTWISRNRILHPTSGANWVNVPLKNSSISIKIHESRILDLKATAQSTIGKLSHYRHKAPYYKQVEDLVKETFRASANDESLVDLNVNGLDIICKYLDIPFHWTICSKMGLPLRDNLGPGDWALEICSLVGAKAYLNPIGGCSLFSASRFEEKGVSLNFLKTSDFIYNTRPFEFIQNLSIIDVLMWNAPATVREAIKTSVSIEVPPVV
jgi:hypothetical protein